MTQEAPMTAEANKETVRRWFTDAVRGGTDAQRMRQAAEETFSPHFIDHDGPDPEHGYEALLNAVPALLQALPDARLEIEQLIGEGDLVAVRLRGRATHTGDLPGRAATGKTLSWTENEIFRFEAGRIAESWGEGTLDAALGEVGLGFGSP
ncbi:ester cyclase [Sinomonas soli]